MSIIRQAFLVQIPEEEIRELLLKHHACLRDEDWAIEKVEERSYGGLRVWITTLAADKGDDREPF